MRDNPCTFPEWEKNGGSYPTIGTLYNWTRSGEVRDEMTRAGVIVRVHGRWIFNPEKWRDYCSNRGAISA